MSKFIDCSKNAVLIALDFPMSAYSSSTHRKKHMKQVYDSLNIVWSCYTLGNHKALIMSTEDGLTDKYWEVTYDTGRHREIGRASCRERVS